MSGKIGSNPFSSLLNAVTDVAKKATETVTTAATKLHEETKKGDAEHHEWGSSFDASGGSATVGYGRGFGNRLDEAPTLKTIQTKNHTDVDVDQVDGLRGKAKASVKNAVNNLGINVFDAEKSKFDAEAGLLHKAIDEQVVDQKGLDTGYRVLTAYAEGSGNVKIGKATNIEGHLEAGAVVAQGEIQGKKSLGAVDLSGKVEGTVGAVASANGKIQVDLFAKKPTVKVKAGVDAFVGAKVSAEGRVGNDWAGVGVKGEAMAGLGAKAKVDAGIEGGRFKAKVELGAALGVGGSVSFNVDVNYQKIGEKALDMGKTALSGVTTRATNALNGAKDVASSGWKTVSGWFH